MRSGKDNFLNSFNLLLFLFENLSEGEISNGERILTEESFNFAIDAFEPDTFSRKILTLHRAELLEWLHSLDLIWSRKSEEQEFNFCPLISDLVGS